ncbi:AAA family ATPase [Actinomycetospora atypica]|uniref:AAA family ATPase n=1 Tax=Actinomycetospora atypica TaxID=1290095 RepID=A0ABV9Z000_9PSEU
MTHAGENNAIPLVPLAPESNEPILQYNANGCPVRPAHFPKDELTTHQVCTHKPDRDDEIITAYREAYAKYVGTRTYANQDECDAADRAESEVSDRMLLDGDIRKEMRRQEAQQVVKRKRAEKAFTPPATLPTLADELAEDIEPLRPRIESLCHVENNVLCAAKAKAGKTTLCVNLLRSLADGTPFLGELAVTPPEGNIGYFNYEMSRRQFNTWLRAANIQRQDRVSIVHLRGHRLPLITIPAQDWIVEWATKHRITTLVIDPWGQAMTESGSENSNDDVGVVLRILGEIKRRAGITDLFVIAHMGHGASVEGGQERARGASALLGWPDVLWTLTEDGGDRFLSAQGRDVEFPEQALTFLHEDRRLVLRDGGGDRRRERRSRSASEVVEIVTAEPGLSTSQVMDKMRSTTQREARSHAVRDAKAEKLIEARQDGRASRLYPLTQLPSWTPRFD